MRAALLALLALVGAVAAASTNVRFTVTYPADAFQGPFSGRVVVFLSKSASQPRLGPNWFSPEPMYAADFRDVRPGRPMVIEDRNAIGFPGRLRDLPPGEYNVQAVVDRNLGRRTIGSSPGNLFSATERITIAENATLDVKLDASNVVPPLRLTENRTNKLVRWVSPLLTKHYGRPFEVLAGVALPEAWFNDPDRRFPAYYEVSGFGGTDNGPSLNVPFSRTLKDGEPFLHVSLDASCPTGHSVFADSATNGPWGRMLTEELIPEIERRFRGIPDPGARFVGGHSSGGWSSLWLQVAYPAFFNGCFSTAPDPIDFRDFQKIDLYAPNQNMFVDADGKPRPLARVGGNTVILYRQFSDMERPLRGEQLGSFEAVFSPRGKDGNPLPLWNRDTGAIDPKVAEAWRKYDIGYILRTRWNELAPSLNGKIHIVMGTEDTFLLEGAVRLTKADLEKLGADVHIQLVPGDHGSILTRDLRTDLDRRMADRFRAWRKEQAPKRERR